MLSAARELLGVVAVPEQCGLCLPCALQAEEGEQEEPQQPQPQPVPLAHKVPLEIPHAPQAVSGAGGSGALQQGLALPGQLLSAGQQNGEGAGGSGALQSAGLSQVLSAGCGAAHKS